MKQAAIIMGDSQAVCMKLSCHKGFQYDKLTVQDVSHIVPEVVRQGFYSVVGFKDEKIVGALVDYADGTKLILCWDCYVEKMEKQSGKT